jgi:two-component system sensor histidine kinase PhoQ
LAVLQSLRARVLLWVSLALTVLFAITIVGLDATFVQSSEANLRDELQVQLLGLIAAAEESGNQELTLPEDAIVDLSLTVPESGVYGIIWNSDGVPIWQSASWLGRDWKVERWPAPGERIFLRVAEEGQIALEGLLTGITWDFRDGSSGAYTFGVAVAEDPHLARVAAFRRNLVIWFTSITLTMLLVLTILLRYALKPLRRLVSEVGEIETGGREAVTEELPSELTGLARNLNFLIDSERRRAVRYQNTLDDLAHSLKTPLAAIRALLAEHRGGDAERTAKLNAEVERMDQRIGYQLRRARASGGTGLGLAPVKLEPLVDDIVGTLDKVYRDKQVSCELEIDSGASFQGDPGDLTEILGNLLDNAYKYSTGRVLLEIRSVSDRVEIVVHDDGPGIPPEAAAHMLERGARADESVPGQGIGLAVVVETLDLYQGDISIDRSPLGGTALRVALPRRRQRFKK